eukprot:g44757.t1
MEYPEDAARMRPRFRDQTQPCQAAGILGWKLPLKEADIPGRNCHSWMKLSARPLEYLEAEDEEHLYTGTRLPCRNKTTTTSGDRHVSSFRHSGIAVDLEPRPSLCDLLLAHQETAGWAGPGPGLSCHVIHQDLAVIYLDFWKACDKVSHGKLHKALVRQHLEY